MSQRRGMPRGHDFYMDYWHRRDSLERFVDRHRAEWMSQIDIDSCEYCHLGGCLEPVALIETKLVWSDSKTLTVTKNLARRASLAGSVFLVEYDLERLPVYCDDCGRPAEDPENDIKYFVVTNANGDSHEMDPAQYAEWLWSLRFPHWENECTNPARKRMLQWHVEGKDEAA